MRKQRIWFRYYCPTPFKAHCTLVPDIIHVSSMSVLPDGGLKLTIQNKIINAFPQEK